MAFCIIKNFLLSVNEVIPKDTISYLVSQQEVINEMTNKFIDIATKLSFEDMLQIDEYITKNNLLTK